jgi:hypothetical protein
LQILFVDDTISRTPRCSKEPKLHGLELIVNPSDEIVEVLLAALRWDMHQHSFGLVAEGLDKLHNLSVEMLELLKENMLDRIG